MDPDGADYFYLPIVRDVEYRAALYSNEKGNKRAPSRMDTVLLEAMENENFGPWNDYLKVTDKYWKRYKGADHIIVMPAPVTNLRHQAGWRGFGHYMIQLNRPIFLNVEFSRAFVKEFGDDCADKNLVLPYPMLDNNFYNGKLLNKPPNVARDKLLYYSGGRHGSCVFIREALNEIMRNTTVSPQIGGRKREVGYRRSVFCPIPVGDSPSSKRQYEVLGYGCVPVVLSDDLVYAFTADAGASFGITNESSFALRLPQKLVQISAGQTNHQNAFPDGSDASPPLGLLPLGTSVEDLLRRVVMQEADDRLSTDTWQFPDGREPRYPYPNALPRLLEKIPRHEIMAMQANVAEYGRKTRYYKTAMEGGSIKDKMPVEEHRLPDGGAIDMMTQYLSGRKKAKGGIAGTADRCDQVRKVSHTIGKSYPCNRYSKDGLRIDGKAYKAKSAPAANTNVGVLGSTSQSERRLTQQPFGNNVVGVEDANNHILRSPWTSPWSIPSDQCRQCARK